jgi:hypothetical protein
MKQNTKETIGSRGTVAGFRPLIGEERWHSDDFTAEMLEGGYRPLLLGEAGTPGDDCESEFPRFTRNWVKVERFGLPPSSFPLTGRWRTKRPLPPPQVETFEAHGHVWYRHVPGDACPMDGGAPTVVLHKDESPNHAVKKAKHWHWDAKCFNIIGYRFPDFPAVHTPSQQEQPVIRGVGPYKVIETADTTKQRLATMYHGWCDVAPDSVAECIADVAKVLYPTDAERCEAAFQKWWWSIAEQGMEQSQHKPAWVAAWKAAKESKV